MAHRANRFVHPFMVVLLLSLLGAVNAVAEQGPQRFATVWRQYGEVTATTGDGTARKLREGDAVFVGERVRTTATAEAMLNTDDAGFIALRPGAALVAERFVAEGKPGDNVSLRVLVGGLRIISGWIGHINRPGYRVLTPTATIGIRGTDHEPYVLTEELAQALAETAGTYDKVNRGGTSLDANGGQLNIERGQVGFIRASKAAKTRALITLVLPVLLDQVPGFYVPGRFDAEMDRLSATADANAAKQLERRQSAAPGPMTDPVVPNPAIAATAEPATTRPNSAAPAVTALHPGAADAGALCGANAVAKTWLAQLDGAIARHQTQSILRMFAEGVVIHAEVRNQDGAVSKLDIERDEFAQSTRVAIKGLRGYKQRRLSVEGRALDAPVCNMIGVKSVVIEQGIQNGTPYRFESVEDYVLERRSEKWRATAATTTQR